MSGEEEGTTTVAVPAGSSLGKIGRWNSLFRAFHHPTRLSPLASRVENKRNNGEHTCWRPKQGTLVQNGCSPSNAYIRVINKTSAGLRAPIWRL